MSNIKSRQLSVYTPIILCFLISLGIYYFNVEVTAIKIKKLESDIENKNKSLLKLNELALNPNKYKLLEENILAKKFELNSMLPSKIELTDFLKNIELISEENRISLENVYPQDLIKSSEYIKIPINLLFLGNYQNIISFFNRIEKMDRLVTIDNLAIVKNKDDKLEVEILLYIYALKKDEDK